MLHKIAVHEKMGNSHISILYPGKALGNNDSGIGSIGRIDQAEIHGSTVIRMHPHSNDEILSYFRTGTVIHTDSAGITATLGRNKLMLMKAGNVFYHEEKIIDRLEGLQIFIRPMQANDKPAVIFHDLLVPDSIDEWREIASFKAGAPLLFSSRTQIFDLTLSASKSVALPDLDLENTVLILYVFQGSAQVNASVSLAKGESVVISGESATVSTSTGAEMVLFATDAAQDCFKQGMFSGNQLQQP